MEMMRTEPTPGSDEMHRTFDFEPFLLEPRQPVGPPLSEPAPVTARPRRKRALAIVAVAAVFAAGVGIGSLVDTEIPGIQETALPTTTLVDPQPSTPNAATSPGTPRPAPSLERDARVPSADEPVAFVAAVLRPSIVQIDTQLGLGSGFIYDSSGLIMTAAHVVDGSSDVVVTFADGTRVDGVVVGQDLLSDVAVVSVEVDGPLPVAALALEDDLAPGQLAVAIGSPFGLEQTITAGIVSNVSRPVVGSDGTVRDLVQTDASINPGNSGGALADRQGRVIGINDLIFSRSGGNDGVGFAIPIGYAKQIADQLVEGMGIETARLGVSGTDPTRGTAGALVTIVEPDSPADDAGLAPGDLIVALDGDAVQSFVDLAAAIRALLPGDAIDLTVLRDGVELTLSADLTTS
jgi:S1-C subfamily serine protease